MVCASHPHHPHQPRRSSTRILSRRRRCVVCVPPTLGSDPNTNARMVVATRRAAVGSVASFIRLPSATKRARTSRESRGHNTNREIVPQTLLSIEPNTRISYSYSPDITITQTDWSYNWKTRNLPPKRGSHTKTDSAYGSVNTRPVVQ